MDQRLIELAARIAEALERLAPPPLPPVALDAAEAFVWHSTPPRLAPVAKVSRVDMSLLQGVDRQKQILLDNTLRSCARAAGQQRHAVGRARGVAGVDPWLRRCTRWSTPQLGSAC